MNAAVLPPPSGQSRYPQIPALPVGAGVCLKSQHYVAALNSAARPAFVEVHAENYLHAGGPAHRFLEAIRADYRLSIHGVGLSLGGPVTPDAQSLASRRALLDRYQPDQFSEHLAWSSLDGRFYNDLLPLAYTPASLRRVVDHIDTMQNALARRVLIENPASYLQYRHSSIAEPAFLAELTQRTGCGLLLDINNIVVSAANHRFDAAQYLYALPLHAVGEIHLAGHAKKTDRVGTELLIDSHDAAVQPATWALFQLALTLTGPLPTLLEWDQQVPEWEVLLAQAALADTRLRSVSAAHVRH